MQIRIIILCSKISMNITMFSIKSHYLVLIDNKEGQFHVFIKSMGEDKLIHENGPLNHGLDLHSNRTS